LPARLDFFNKVVKVYFKLIYMTTKQNFIGWHLWQQMEGDLTLSWPQSVALRRILDMTFVPSGLQPTLHSRWRLLYKKTNKFQQLETAWNQSHGTCEPNEQRGKSQGKFKCSMRRIHGASLSKDVYGCHYTSVHRQSDKVTRAYEACGIIRNGSTAVMTTVTAYISHK
jgi:hypothetical protein